MKYIYAILIFIGLSSSAFAEGQNTRWILLNSIVWLPSKPPIVQITQEASTGHNGYVMHPKKETFETESDCYTALKDVALAKNKKEKNISSGHLYKIEIIDDIKIRASFSNDIGTDDLHCIEITLSR